MVIAIAKVKNVWTERAGTVFSQDALAGETVLHLQEVFDFGETAGQLEIEGVVYSFTDPDDDALTVTITPGLAADVADGDPVFTLPISEQKIAQVSVLDSDESYNAIVDHPMKDKVPEGIREEGQEETCQINNDNGPWVLTTFLAQTLTVDGTYLDPDTLPAVDSTDSLPPSTSPTAVVNDFSVGAVLVSWDAVVNADPVTYDVYASLSTPVTTADELVTSINGTRTIIQRIGGNQIPLDGVTPVYVAILARDADGPNPGGLGVEGSGAARKADNELISALYAYLGSIEANQITAGELEAIISISTDGIINVGNRITIAHPDAEEGGITIWGDDAHTIVLVRLHPDGSYFDGLITAQELTVVQSLRILGALSAIASGGRVKIENGVADPVAPVVNTGDLTVPHSAPPAGYTAYGLAWDNSATSGDGVWWQLLRRNSDNRPCVRWIDPFWLTTGSIVVLADNRDVGESYWSTPGGFAVDAANQRCYVWSGFATSSTDQWRLHRYSLATGANSGSGIATIFDNGLDALRPTVACDGTSVYYQGDPADLGKIYKDNLNLNGTVTYARIPTDADVTTAKLKSITSITIGAPDVGDASTLSFHEFVTGNMYNFTMVTFSGAVPNLVRNSAKDFNIGLNFWHGYSDNGITRATLITRARTSNVTTLTTTGAHGFQVGEQVKVTGLADATMNGTFIITAVPSTTTFSYANAGANVASTGSGGSATTRSGFYAQDQSATLKRYSPYFPSAGEKVWAQFANINGANHTNMSPESVGVAVAARKWAWVTLGALPPGTTGSEVWVGYGSASPGTTKKKRLEAIVSRVQILYGGKITGTDAMYTTNTLGGSPGEIYTEAVVTVTNKALTSNVAKLTLGLRHGFEVGQSVVVAGIGAPFDGTYTITAVNFNSIYYAKVNANVASAASGGSVTGVFDSFKGTGAQGGSNMPSLDRPWTNVTYAAGYTMPVGDPAHRLAVKKKMGRVWLEGWVTKTTAWTASTNHGVATLPEEFWPPSVVAAKAMGSRTQTPGARCIIGVTGLIEVDTGTVVPGAGGTYFLDNISWDMEQKA